MKDLFLIFTLLSLLCFTSSLLDTEQMTKLNEMFQKTKLIFERLKSEQNKNEERRLMIEHKEINENIQKLKRDILRKKVNNMLDSAFIPHLLEDLLAEVLFIGIMRAIRARGETVVRLTNHLVIIVPLLVLFYSKNSLAFEAQLDMFKRKFEALFEEGVIYKKEEQTRNETIYKLLDEARSLTDQKQLKIFKQNLQGLVDQAHRQKIKEKDHIAALIQQVTSKLVELYPTLQLLERTAMAEVTSVTNRRAVGIRTTKCLFLLFTLLSLVSFTKAALNKKQLIELKQMYQKTKEKYQRLKSEHMSRMHTSSDKIMDYKKMIDMLTPLVRKYEEHTGRLPLKNIKQPLLCHHIYFSGMAGVTSVRNRRWIGIRIAKSLFIIFPLLDLVCLTCSQSGKERMTVLQELCLKTKEELQRLKRAHLSAFSTSDAVGESVNIMDSMKALMKKYNHNLPGDQPAVDQFLKKTKVVGKKKDDNYGQREG
ncbi:hypothetical protein AMECASPLE_007092 [Ameca splendens]|uniref:Uncharacterized protein n=1 Tax=Ameca splendens TaxID=208324 RepID=A0ABV0YM94_9TELE